MWLDDIIEVISPKTAFKRKQARYALDMIRGYEGAKTGRRIDDWITSSTSANSEIGAAGTRLRQRARDLVRNNCYASKAIEVFVGNTVGTGITAQAQSGSDVLNKKIMDEWRNWCQFCDADGDLDFAGIQSQVTRAMFESGECFVRFQNRGTSGTMRIPLQLQVLEADFLDSSKNSSTSHGNIIRQGIEFDSKGARVAYWLFREHPGENMVAGSGVSSRGSTGSSSRNSSGASSVRVPASEILHIFRKLRPGQYRGVSAFAPSMVRMRDLDGYDDAELWRKKIEACFAAFVVQNNGVDGPIIGSGLRKGAGGGGSIESQKIEEFRPGMIEYLQPGEDVRFASPTSDGNYESYQRVQLHAIAAGLGITYEQMTGDLSQVNYSSLRAGLLEFRRTIEMIRWQVLIPKLCIPVWRRFIDRAFVAGVINKAAYEVCWTPPKFEMVDPLKDAQADTLMIRSGTMTLHEAIARQGYDPEQQIEEIAKINKKLDAHALILDSDPRNTARSGMAQMEQNTKTDK